MTTSRALPMQVDSTRRTRVSAVVLVKNEELFIERCLNSIKSVVDEIVVLDSGSTDRTCEIALKCGALVFEQPWMGWIQQRAHAISLASNDWVLIIEADEIVTPELAESLREVLSSDMNVDDGYSVDRRDDFCGALLPRMRRRSKRINFIRVFNRTRSQYDPEIIIHDEVRVPGRAIALSGALIHWRGFTIVEQVRRYAEYAPLEADVMQARGKRVHVWHMVIRPIMRFGWCYFARGGFRLGSRGFVHALMVASSEYLRYAALWERQLGRPVLHPPQELFVPAVAAVADTTQSHPSLATTPSMAVQSSASVRQDATVSMTGTAA